MRSSTTARITAVTLLLLGDTLAQGPTWASPSTPPSARSRTAVTFDDVRGRSVLFGGGAAAGATLGDTWEHDGDTWIRRTPTNSPPARRGHGLVHDTVRNRTVLYGGTSATGALLTDTWEYDGQNWTQIATPTSPTAAPWQAMAFHDGTNPSVLLLATEAPGLIRTWTYDGTTWTLRNTNALTSRLGGAIAYGAGRTYVHGGGSNAGDMWAWDGTTWLPVSMTTPIGALSNHAMAWDRARQQLVLTTGWNGSSYLASTYYGTLTSPTHVQWTSVANHDPVTNTNLPAAQEHGAMSYDFARRRIMFFGGLQNGAPTAQTCHLPADGVAGPWIAIPTGPQPAPRVHAGMAANWVCGAVLFGGVNGTSVYGDTWTHDGTRWTDHGTTPGVAARQLTALANFNNSQIVMFGGQTASGGTALGDTRIWNGATWAPGPVAGPPARYAHDMVGALVLGKVLLFGGYAGSPLNDTWTYDASGWSPVATPNAPPPRNSHRMAYHEVQQRIVLFGGQDAAGNFLGDTWIFDCATMTWSQASPLHAPPRRWSHAMTYDRARDVVVLTGGYGNPQCGLYCASHLNDVWEWNGVDWRQRAPESTTPSAREGAAFAHATVRGRSLLVGGYGASGTYPADSWLWHVRVDRPGPAMPTGNSPIELTGRVQAGEPFGCRFANPSGFGWMLVYPAADQVGALFQAGLLCSTATIHGTTGLLVDAMGTPGQLGFAMPTAMAGRALTLQGAMLDLGGFCLRVTDPLITYVTF